MKDLARLEKVDLRQAWLREAGDFTPWLAQPDNLKLLGEAISIELECDSQEKWVGPFRADILCKDCATDAWVLIENQLERTDHSHLGQLLTYAAGLDAVTIVWVAERFTEEHRAALDWLNEHTDEKINFFGLEIELWRIGNSPAAPKFNVACKPNDWTRYVHDVARQVERGDLSESEQLHFEYWSEFLNVLRQRKTMSVTREPRTRTWIGFGIGRTGFRLWAETVQREGLIGAGISCRGDAAREQFRMLRSESTEIEKELGFPLEWNELAGRTHYFAIYRAADWKDRKDWPVQHAWLAEKVERFYKVFRERVRALPAYDEDA